MSTVTLGDLVPGAPQLFAAPQVTQQPLFLPGSVEAQIEEYCNVRGWAWHVVRYVAERREALLIREANELLGGTHSEAVLMDASTIVKGDR